MTGLPAPGAVPAALLGVLLTALIAPYSHRVAQTASAATFSEPGSDDIPQTRPMLPVWVLVPLGAAAGALVGVRFGWSAQLPAYLVLAAITAPLAAIDLAAHQIPDRLLAPAAALTLLFLAAASARDGAWQPLIRALLAALVLAAVFLVVVIAAGGGFGLADVKFSFLMGMWLGYQSWPSVEVGVFAGFVLAAITAGLLAATTHRIRGAQIALGPHLLAGTLIALVAISG